MNAPIYAVIDPSGKIVNVIHWDGKAVYDASPNTLQPVTNTPPHIGGTFKDGVFSPPPAPIVPAPRSWFRSLLDRFMNKAP